MQDTPMTIRQGDVLLQATEEVGVQLMEGTLDGDGAVTLARGEVTGHRHRLERQAIADGAPVSRVYFHPEAPGTVACVHLQAAQLLVHEEHTSHQVRAGIWRVSRPYEYDGTELRRVED
jgi:hypothetical protein